MIKIKELIRQIEQWAPPALQESYDNAGLIVGDPNRKITGVLICLDSTEEVIDEAIAKGCNFVLAHHPIVFGGLKRLTGKNYVERTVLKAIKNDIALYAAHTNLDNVKHGVNAKIAEKIGLVRTKILAPKNQRLMKLTTFIPAEQAEAVTLALNEAGAGQIGEYKNCSFHGNGTGYFQPSENANPAIGEANRLEKVQESRVEVIFPDYLQGSVLSALRKHHPYEEVAYYLHRLENTNQEIGSGMVGELEQPMSAREFLLSLKERMNLQVIKHTHLCKKEIRKVALCGGSGSFLLGKAKAHQADIYITGDFKYHEFFDAENSIIIADIGHYESEAFTKELFYEYLSKKIPNIALYLSSINTNPIQYI